MVVVQQSYTLIDGRNSTYTFETIDNGVVVRFSGPTLKYNTVVTVPTTEARELYARLLKHGYKRW